MDDPDVVVGRRRGLGWRRVAHGLHRSVTPGHHDSAAPSQQEVRLRARADRMADLLAWQHVLPDSACFTHLTAVEVHGLWLPPVPDGLPVSVCLPKGEDRPRRKGLRVSRLTGTFSPLQVHGLRVAPAPELLLACARDLGLLDVVVLLDSALRRGLCSMDDLSAVAAPRRRGGPALRAAMPFVDPRSESPWETLLRMLHVLCEVPVEPQFEVYDEQGGFVARGDLRIAGTRTLHEYDGAVHRDRRAHVRDLARERRLANVAWIRRGYTSGDLLGRAHVVLREADAALGRRHDPRRLDPWLDALRESLFSCSGRTRLLRRFGVA